MKTTLHVNITKRTTILSLAVIGLTGLMMPTPTMADELQNRDARRAPINARQVAQRELPREMRRLRRINTALMETTTVSHDPMTGKTYIEAPRPLGMHRMRGPAMSPGFPGTAPEVAEPVQQQPDTQGEIGFQKVFGSDERIKAGSTAGMPHRAICKLIVEWPNGMTGGGTGTLIGNKYVLTAGHCAYNSGKGGFASEIKVVPGQHGNSKPYGTQVAVWYRCSAYINNGEDDDYDYCLLTLNKKIGNTTGWFGLASLSDDTLDSSGAIIWGYPGDLGGGQFQYGHWGPILDYCDTEVYYRIDTNHGQSGAGVYRMFGTNRYVFAVHTGSDWYWLSEYNQAARITNTRFYLILDWIASGT